LQAAKKSAMRHQSLLGLAAKTDLNSCGLELGNSPTADPRVWIRNRHNTARNARRN
jgi:hypothetical protein